MTGGLRQSNHVPIHMNVRPSRSCRARRRATARRACLASGSIHPQIEHQANRGRFGSITHGAASCRAWPFDSVRRAIATVGAAEKRARPQPRRGGAKKATARKLRRAGPKAPYRVSASAGWHARAPSLHAPPPITTIPIPPPPPQESRFDTLEGRLDALHRTVEAAAAAQARPRPPRPGRA